MGGVVGVVVLISLVLIFFLCYRRKKSPQGQVAIDTIPSGRTYTQESIDEKSDEINFTQKEEDYSAQAIGGRIRYPDEDDVLSGRLQARN